jgi:methyl-accepting chemotaxis protein
MKWFNNLKIGTKLLSGFILIALIAGVIGFIGIKQIRLVDERDTFLYEKMTVPMSHLGNVATNFQQIRINLRDIIIANDPEDIQFYESEINRHKEIVTRESLAYEKLIINEDMRQTYNQFFATREDFLATTDQIVALAKANRDEDALETLYSQATVAAEVENEAIKKMTELKIEDARETSDENSEAADSATIQMEIFLFFGVALAIGLGIIITRGITKPVHVLKQELNALAENGGDLTQEIKVNSQDEVGDLAQAVNKFLVNLREIMTKVRDSSIGVAATAEQLNSSSQQTAASANETAATMGEISTTVEQVSTNVQEIANASEITKQHAQNGSEKIDIVKQQFNKNTEVTTKVGGVVNNLNDKAKEISQIVNIITQIAEQTNLLALNAAIEAARAGEAGRGFAVVAEEVRKLAEESGQATQKIYNIVNGIQVETNNAVTEMNVAGQVVDSISIAFNELGDAFIEIDNSINNLASQIEDIASATEQMSSGVQNVAATTEEQTAAMEEVSASAESLSTLAEGLNELVGKFKV